MSRSDSDQAFEAYLNHRRPEDLERVFNEVAPRLLLLASHFAGKPGEAEDAVQATFLRAIEVADRFERGRPVLPWLTGILVREAKKLKRSSSRAPDPNRLELPAAQEGPDSIAEFEEMRATLTKAVDSLPDSYSNVMTLRIVHGLTPTEIAHALKLPPETVKTRIRRATEKLRHLVPAALMPTLTTLAFSGQSLAMVRIAVLEAAAARTATVTTVVAAGTVASRVLSAGRTSFESIGRWLAGAGATAAVATGTWLTFFNDEPAPERIIRTEIVDSGNDDAERIPRTAVAGIQTEEQEADAPVRDTNLVAFEGELRDADGWDYEGVQVELLRLHPDALVTPFAKLPQVLQAPPFIAGTTHTDASGRFVFEDITPWGLFLLRILEQNSPPRLDFLSVRPRPGETIDLGKIKLPRPFEATGRVVDPSGVAIPDARVRRVASVWDPPEWLGVAGGLLAAASRESFEHDGGLAVRGASGWTLLEQPLWLRALVDHLSVPPARTGGDGRFLWLSHEAGTINVYVDADGYEPVTAQITAGIENREPIILQRLPDLDLTVQDVNGEVLPEAEVMLGALESERAPRTVMCRVGTTDESGRLNVSFPEHVPTLIAARRGSGEPWHVARLAQRTGTLRLPAVFPLTLRVVDRTQAPIASPRVRLVPGEPLDANGPGTVALYQLGAIAELDLDDRLQHPEAGEVLVEDVPSGAWMAYVTAPGYETRAVALDLRGAREVVVALTKLETTEIGVRNAGFEAVGGVPLVARPVGRDDPAHALPSLIGHTDESGSLQLDRPLWTEDAFSAASPAYGWIHAAAGEGTNDMQLVMPARGRIVGKLISKSDELEPAEWRIVARRSVTTATAIAEPPIWVAPLPDGSFVVPALESGTWVVHAVPALPLLRDPAAVFETAFLDLQDYPSDEARLTPGGFASVIVDPSPPPEDEEEEEEEPDSLRGIVIIDARPGTELVGLLQHNSVVRRVALDAEGRFDAGTFERGPIELCFVHPSQLENVVSGTLPDRFVWRTSLDASDAAKQEIVVDLRMSPWSAIVSTADGRRAHTITLELSGQPSTTTPGRARMSFVTDAGGFGSLDALPAGRHILRVRHPEFGWLEHEFVSGPTIVKTGMSMSLNRLLHVSGHVAARTLGVELERGSQIELERIDDDGVGQRRIGPVHLDGAYRVERLLPGRFRATLRIPRRIRGTPALLPITQNPIEVLLPEFEVPLHDLDGLDQNRRRGT